MSGFVDSLGTLLWRKVNQWIDDDGAKGERRSMKKLMSLTAMLAMLLVAAAPAFAETQTATGGNSFVSGGSIFAKNSVVAQSPD